MSVHPIAMAFAVLACACASGPLAKQPTGKQRTDALAGASGSELFEMGKRLAQSGDAVRAEQYLSAAIERGHPSEEVLPLLMHVCIVSSRLGAALQYATPYLQLHPDDYQLRYLVASLHVGLGQPEQARAELLRVVSEHSEFAAPHYLLGLVLRDSFGDEAGAATHFKLHQQLDPQGTHGVEVTAWLRQYERSKGSRSERKPRPVQAAP